MATNLNGLKSLVGAYAEDCADATATLRGFKFGTDNALSFRPDGGEVMMGGKFNEWSFNQLCFKMDVPAGWVGNPKHCPEELKVEILDELAGRWRDEANMLIRMKGETIRAVLSDQYSIFDNNEFVDLVGEAVSTMGIEPQVHRYTVGDDMHAYMVFPQITFADDPQANNNHDDGGLHPALYLSNSERGGGSARVVGAVYRSICTNGVIYGWRADNTMQVRHRYHSRAMMAALMADGIAEGLRMSEEATKRFIATQDKKVAQVNLGGIINDWASKYGLTVDAKDNWLSAIATETVVNNRREDPRVFDLINAATYVAQTRSESETEIFERMAGDILRTM